MNNFQEQENKRFDEEFGWYGEFVSDANLDFHIKRTAGFKSFLAEHDKRLLQEIKKRVDGWTEKNELPHIPNNLLTFIEEQ